MACSARKSYLSRRHAGLLAVGVLAFGLAGVATRTGAAAPAAHEPAATTTPAKALAQLKAGNQRFAGHKPAHPRQNVARLAEVAKGQHPVAVVVGCADSRVPPELVFDEGLGDLFVVRTAGEVVDDAALGSIEYAVEHLHTPLVIVLGHQQCGAVQATVEAVTKGGEAPGKIGRLIEAIRPAVESVKGKPGDVVANGVDAQVRATVNQLKGAAPLLSEAVAAGHVQVVGAVYSLDSGAVAWQ